MTATLPPVANPDQPAEAPVEKGLKANAVSLVSNVVIGVASTAPAYSLAATLGLIVVAVGVLSPVIVVLAFVPMLFVSIGYSELNKADPDCGTTFTWATRTFKPWIGWLGGWGIIASDVLVMASLAQVSGQYGFLLFGAKGIGENPTSGWVLLVGVLFIVVLTYVCYRGIELSATSSGSCSPSRWSRSPCSPPSPWCVSPSAMRRPATWPSAGPGSTPSTAPRSRRSSPGSR